MKQLKALSALVLGIFLISFASATVVGGGGWGEIGSSQILTINDGEEKYCDSEVFNNLGGTLMYFDFKSPSFVPFILSEHKYSAPPSVL